MNRPCNPLKHGWLPTHTRMLHRLLKGESQISVGKVFGRSRYYVAELMTTDEYKKRFEQESKSIIEKVQKVFEEAAVSAAKTIKSISKHGKPEERVKLDAAKDIIDRIGYKPIQVIETRQRAYSPEEIASAQGTAKELEETVVRLERHDSLYLLKKEKSEVAPMIKPIENAEPTSQPSQDRPQTVSA